ncbi:stealth family protein [Weissella paramesenteroides]|uniref:stealth family protein n=1 Tax=Weissella paramesenteroides TaxID=1249 RepID=UPI003F225A8A
MRQNNKIGFPIDFVVTWVNDSDREWQEQKNKYSTEEHDDKPETRFRDTGLFKYWFRAVEEYTPWVNHIYLVTNGQIPSFLNLKSEKISLVRHEEIMPSSSLPTFNSNAIELNLNKITGLSEHFVVFNDDMFINKSLRATDFFSVNGVPKDTAGLNQIMPVENFDHITANNISIINNNFDKSNVLHKHWRLFLNVKNGPLNIYTLLLWFFPRFSRLYDLHIAYSFNKNLFNEFVDQNNEIVSKTVNSKFRSVSDISLWGIRYFQIVSGNIYPRKYNFGKFYTLQNWKKIIFDLTKEKHGIIAINDTKVDDYDQIIEKISNAFQSKFPGKSHFEM